MIEMALYRARAILDFFVDDPSILEASLAELLGYDKPLKVMLAASCSFQTACKRLSESSDDVEAAIRYEVLASQRP